MLHSFLGVDFGVSLVQLLYMGQFAFRRHYIPGAKRMTIPFKLHARKNFNRIVPKIRNQTWGSRTILGLDR